MKDRKHKRFCSKHQTVHGEHTNYWSCCYPNDKDMNEKQKANRKDPRSTDEYYG